MTGPAGPNDDMGPGLDKPPTCGGAPLHRKLTFSEVVFVEPLRMQAMHPGGRDGTPAVLETERP